MIANSDSPLESGTGASIWGVSRGADHDSVVLNDV